MPSNSDNNSWGLSSLFQINFEDLVTNPSNILIDNIGNFSKSTVERLTSINPIDANELTSDIKSQVEGFSSSLIENLLPLNAENISSELKTKTEDAGKEVNKLTFQATESIKNAGEELSKSGKELFDGVTYLTNDALGNLKNIVSPDKIEVNSELKEDTTKSTVPSTSSSNTPPKTDSITEITSISDSDNLSTRSKIDSTTSKTISTLSRAKSLLGFGKKSSIRSDSSSDNSGPLSRAPSISESIESSSSKSSLSSAFGKLKSGFGKLKSRSSSSSFSRSSSSSSSISSSSSFSSSFSRSSSISSSTSSSSSSSRSSSRSSKTGDSEDAEKTPSIFSRSYKRFHDFKNGKDNTVLWLRNTDRGGNVNFEAQVPLRCPSLNLSGKLGNLRKKMHEKSSKLYKTSGEAYTNLSEILSSSRSNSYSSNSSGSSWNISSSLSRAKSGVESFGNYISESSGSLNMRESISENWRAIKEFMPDKSYSSGSGSYCPDVDMSELSRKGSNALRSASRGISSMRDKFMSSSWSAGIGFDR